MLFTQLPPEILLQIASTIESESDLASFVQVNRGAYQTLISQLYLRNAEDSGGSAILLAAKSGNCSTLGRALQAWRYAKSPAELPTTSDREKYTPLFLAAIRGNLAAVKMLLDYGVDPNVRDRVKRTPLYVASGRGHTAVVETLLAQPKIKVNAYDKDRITPICFAARNGHAEIVKMLLSSGAHAGFVYREGRQGPIHSTIVHKQPELVQLLVNRKDVDPNALSSGRTPLEIAVDANKEDLVEILLTDKRVNPDLTGRSRSRTPLLKAALKSNEAMVRLLLAAGANKEIQDATFLSPAMLLDAPSAEARRQLIQGRSLLDSDPDIMLALDTASD
ncbi:ankyrin [Penicillium lividum]|nr:ankyrin [Penicillium lividum]